MTQISLFDIPDKDERGVSPVIGVILMVAITVILAAVIATFVLGFPDQVNQNANAGVDISADNGEATVTWISQGNSDQINVTANGTSKTLDSVGDTLTVANGTGDIDAPEGDVTIVATAVSGDTETVVQQESVNISA